MYLYVQNNLAFLVCTVMSCSAIPTSSMVTCDSASISSIIFFPLWSTSDSYMRCATLGVDTKVAAVAKKTVENCILPTPYENEPACQKESSETVLPSELIGYSYGRAERHKLDVSVLFGRCADALSTQNQLTFFWNREDGDCRVLFRGVVPPNLHFQSFYLQLS